MVVQEGFLEEEAVRLSKKNVNYSYRRVYKIQMYSFTSNYKANKLFYHHVATTWVKK